MNTPPGWPAYLPRWLRYVGVWILLMIVCAPQTFWGDPARSWLEVFWIQVTYWSAWAILSPGIFLLCRRLHEGPRTWRRYAPGLLMGALVVSLLHPLITESITFVRSWIDKSGQADQPGQFLSRLSQTVMKNTGTNPFMFGVIACVWYAMRHSRDLREKQIRSAELESLLRDAQLRALRSQLNPHFLFNTLHSIAELVHEDPNLAEQLILRLGDLLRKALASSGRQEVTLAEELEN